MSLDDVDSNGVVQDRNKWRAFVDTVMELWVSYHAGNFLGQLRNYKYIKKGYAAREFLLYFDQRVEISGLTF